MKQLSIVILAIILISSCKGDIVTVPEFEPIASDRVVLLEEMTGVSCPNCPKGTAEVEAIKVLYGDQVIPVGIHGIFLAWPTSDSKYDLRNDFSKALETSLAPGTSKPAALINRAIPSGEDEKVILSPELWAGYIEEQLAQPPKVSIELELSYSTDSRMLDINAGIVGIESIDSETKISVMILENKIIDAQKNLQEVIPDFEHNHVLRTMLTPFDGEVLSPSIAPSEIFNKTYQFQVPNEEELWIPDHLEIIVFVHSSITGEVLQAAMKKLD